MSSGIDVYSFLMVFLFVVGYLAIIFEQVLHVNKATTALIMAVLIWGVQFGRADPEGWNLQYLNEHLANVSQVIFFLVGALTIVEIIHAHGGFQVMGQLMRVRSKSYSLWVIGITSFFLSAVLDNLTTTLVMVMMIRKMIFDREERMIFGSMIVIAANAGGAWTPIGDVTTTMLWLGERVTTIHLIKNLFFPSLICLAFSLLWFSRQFRGQTFALSGKNEVVFEPKGRTVFALGLLSLVSVPVFKMMTGLPPFMGMLLAMSFMWFITDAMHRRHDDREHLRVLALLPRLDLSSILFFLGILLSVDALETAGILENVAHGLDRLFPSKEIIATMIGLGSAIIDNVPLVAACMGMYDLREIARDDTFWHLVAYTAGTGGSILIIGSAAGVAFMGLEKVTFFWYLKRISVPAAIGYFAGIGAYLLLN